MCVTQQTANLSFVARVVSRNKNGTLFDILIFLAVRFDFQETSLQTSKSALFLLVDATTFVFCTFFDHTRQNHDNVRITTVCSTVMAVVVLSCCGGARSFPRCISFSPDLSMHWAIALPFSYGRRPQSKTTMAIQFL